MNDIITGDCLDIMKTFPDNHFSAVVTDPPYGLSFMGKGWDHEVPGIGFWQEALRISKPGSYLLAMGGTRTSHRLACSIEDAGFEIRDCIMWLYGSGFPKSHNHFGIEGYGTALKPAYEPIILAMKPLDGTFKQNAEKWGQAGINIDGCRIPTQQNDDIFDKNPHTHNKGEGWCVTGAGSTFNPNKGRWPANLILDEEAAAMLDEQSGILKSGRRKGFLDGESQNEVYGKRAAKNINPFPANSGGASRFFYCAKTSSKERNEGLDGFPICQTIGGGGTNNTEDDVCGKYGSIKAPSKNHHPTVKPLSLMRYLITLIAPPKNAIILDPFAGSGSTIVAAKQLGIDAIGIEKEKEYAEIARARISHVAQKVQKFAEQSDLFHID